MYVQLKLEVIYWKERDTKVFGRSKGMREDNRIFKSHCVWILTHWRSFDRSIWSGGALPVKRIPSQRWESTGNVKLSAFKSHVDVLQKRGANNCKDILKLDAYTQQYLWNWLGIRFWCLIRILLGRQGSTWLPCVLGRRTQMRATPGEAVNLVPLCCHIWDLGFATQQQ